MTPKNTICLWFDKDAHEAAQFYAATFPDSVVTAVHTAPSDFPGGNFETLARSIREKLYTLPDEVVVYPGHGPSTTIGFEKAHNPFVPEDPSTRFA